MEENNIPTAEATLRYARISARKVKIVADLIRGKDVETARGILENTNTKASRLILKVLNSAVANAVNNNGANESELRISESYIKPGPVYKRIKFASRGNVDRHDKRSSHITVKVTDEAKGVK